MADPLDSEPELLPFASSEERQLLQGRGLSADSEQAMLRELREACKRWQETLNPTREQVLAVAHSTERQHAEQGGSYEHWKALEADWYRKQKPTAEDILKARNPQSDKSIHSAILLAIGEAAHGVLSQPIESTTAEPIASPKVEAVPAHPDKPEAIPLEGATKLSEIFEGLEPDPPPPKTVEELRERLVGVVPSMESPEELLNRGKWGDAEPISPEKGVNIFDMAKPIQPDQSTDGVWVWLRKWAAAGAGLALLGVSWTMIQIDEYLLAGIVLVAAMVAFAVQLYDWKGVTGRRYRTLTVKAFGALLIVAVLTYFGAVIVKKKGDKPWTNLLQATPSTASSPSRAETTLEEPKPNYELAGTIYSVAMGTPALERKNTSVMVIANVTNLGIPTTVKNWSMIVTIPKRGPVDARPRFINPNRPLIFVLSSGESREFSPEDALYNKAISEPLKTNGEITGLLVFDLDNSAQPEAYQPGSIVELKFTDARGNTYTAKRTLRKGEDSVPQYFPGMKPPVIRTPSKSARGL